MWERRSRRKEGARASTGFLVTVVLFVAVAATAGASMGATGPPQNVRPPVIQGAAREGRLLRADIGKWSSETIRRVGYRFQWRLCNPVGAECLDIAKATDSIYAARHEDVGRTVSVTVTAIAPDGTSASLSSAPTPPVTAAPTGAPTIVERPAIDGVAVVGAVLHARAGAWTGTASIRLRYRWRSCSALGGVCRDIDRTSDRYVVRQQDLGHVLRVLVTARNRLATSMSLSDPTATVTTTPAVSVPVSTSEPTIMGVPRVGQVLRATRGSWMGTPPLGFVYTWKRCDGQGKPDASDCLTIDNAGGATYVVRPADVGAHLRAAVTASNAAGSTTATSNATAVVAEPPPAPVKPSPARQPAISGTPRTGATLVATRGNWAGTAPIAFAYRWVRCGQDGGAPDGSNCAPIAGASGAKYRLTSSDIGRKLRIRVTASNAAGSTTAASNPTSTIQAPAPAAQPPRNMREPSIAGSATQGQTLTATGGNWVGTAPITLSYQWVRCGADGGSADGSTCEVIAGATTTKYVLATVDVGARLRVRVTARNTLGTSTVASNATARIAGSEPTRPAGAVMLSNGRYSIPVTSVSLPARLIIDGVSFRPNPVRTRRTLLELRIHVVDTRGYFVRDALIFGRSTPLLTSGAGERRTGMDGWATLRMTPKASFPIRKGYNVQFFVRARKPGGNPLADVSTRRLVQVRTARR